MSREHGIAVRLVPEPENKYDKYAVRVELSVTTQCPVCADKPADAPDHLCPQPPEGATWYHVGFIPRMERGQPTSQQVAGIIARGWLRAVRVIANGTVRADDTLPWWRIKLSYEVPGKRKRVVQSATAQAPEAPSGEPPDGDDIPWPDEE